LARNGDIGVSLEQAAQFVARQPLVIDDDGVHAVASTAFGTRHGIETRAITVLPTGSSVSDAASPYKRRSRSRALRRPSRPPLSDVSVPVLVTTASSRSPA